jgi:radical SAM protein with 4Fe4S-binding SPASM domain
MNEYFKNHDIPVMAYIEPTLRCNERCVHCYVERARADETKEMSRKEIDSILGELAALGSLIVIFTGGEFFLRGDSMDILHDARKRHFAVVIFTNGTCIDRSIAEELYEIAPLGVEISFQGATAQTHDSITALPGAFTRAINAVKYLQQSTVPVKIKLTVMKENYHEYEKFIELAESLGVEHSLDPVIFPRRDGNSEPLSHRLDDRQLEHLLCDPRLTTFSECVPPLSNIEIPESRLCGVGHSIIRISSNGDVYPCVSYGTKAGSLRDTPLHILWHSSPLLVSLRESRNADCTQCAACELRHYCMRCCALAETTSGDFRGCDLVSKKIAELRKKLADEAGHIQKKVVK